jgi:hypothetical protein
MDTESSHRPDATPPPDPARALEDLRYIRETMARASSFTAVPGWGTVAMGATALVAAAIAARQPTSDRWLSAWVAEAVLAMAIGTAATVHKARRVKSPLLSGAGARFVFGFAPPVVAGAALTAVLQAASLFEAMPGTWLLLYGAAVLTGGAFSVRAVRVMGLCFMLAGVLAFTVPPGWGDSFMAIGFGGINILFGTLIALKHGG